MSPKAIPYGQTTLADRQAGYKISPWSKSFERAKGERRFWLVKSEPDVFSFDQLMKAPKKTTGWDSVRNAAARNFMRDAMRKGDGVFYYHSMADPQAIVGVCEVASAEAYPDPTALDPTHPYYDEASDPTAPTWWQVDIRGITALPAPVTLKAIKAHKVLSQMALVRVGRLSVVPVESKEWDLVLKAGGIG